MIASIPGILLHDDEKWELYKSDQFLCNRNL
jgi:hypothetical protein